MQQQGAIQHCAIQQKKVTQDWHFLTPNLTTEGGSSRLILPPDHLKSWGIDLPTDDKCSGEALSFLEGPESPSLPPPKPTTKRSHHNDHLGRKYSLSPFHSPTQHQMASLGKPFFPLIKTNQDQWDPKQHKINQANGKSTRKVLKITFSLKPQLTKVVQDLHAKPKQSYYLLK